MDYNVIVNYIVIAYYNLLLYYCTVSRSQLYWRGPVLDLIQPPPLARAASPSPQIVFIVLPQTLCGPLTNTPSL